MVPIAVRHDKSDNGLMSKMQQVIILTSDGVVYWRVYTLHAPNKLNNVIITLRKYVRYSVVKLIKTIFTRQPRMLLKIIWAHFTAGVWKLINMLCTLDHSFVSGCCHVICWLYMSMHDSSFVFHSLKGWLYVFQRRTAPAAPLPASATAVRAAHAPSAPPRPPLKKPLVGTTGSLNLRLFMALPILFLVINHLNIMKRYTLTCFEVFANRKYVKTSKILYIYTPIPLHFLGD